MCIRDRLPRGAGNHRLAALAARLINDGDEAANLFTQEQRCLLYTSDAADERSSVDLGGRRIIKKKKYDILERDDTLTHKKLREKKHNRI